mgnify:CR=1 FL=1
MTFESLKLHPCLLSALQKSGYTAPTPVQAESIPLALTGVDLNPEAIAKAAEQAKGGAAA